MKKDFVNQVLKLQIWIATISRVGDLNPQSSSCSSMDLLWLVGSVCTHMRALTGTHTHKCVCLEMRGTLQAPSSTTISVFPWVRLSHLIWTKLQGYPWLLSPLHTGLKLQVCHHFWLFNWALWTWTQALTLAQQVLLSTEPSPCPGFISSVFLHFPIDPWMFSASFLYRLLDFAYLFLNATLFLKEMTLTSLQVYHTL